MNKPVNKFAVTMWIAAALVAITNVAEIYTAVVGMKYSYAQGDTIYLVTRSFLAAITGTIAPVAMLVGLGAGIEIVDQMRWDVRNRK